MKKEELIKVLENLEESKSITDKQEYVVSKGVNQIMNNIKPILNDELKRMDMKEVECNSPEIWSFTGTDLEFVTDTINSKLNQLVKEDYKIIDYSITNLYIPGKTYTLSFLGVIKFTS